jgi:hypothetical protein
MKKTYKIETPGTDAPPGLLRFSGSAEALEKLFVAFQEVGQTCTEIDAKEVRDVRAQITRWE